MIKLIKVDNEWVRVEDWLRQRAERLERKEKEKEVNVERCKSYNEIVDTFKGDEQRPEVNKLSRKWQDKVTLSEDLRELRALLGWPLYQEWLKETITG